MELYRIQSAAGRYFLHEHPAQASSWGESVVMGIAGMNGVQVVVGDQCQFGAVDKDSGPIKKPTKFMTSCNGIAEALTRRCQGRGGTCSRVEGGRHVLCNGKTAILAAIYPFDLCRAIFTGLKAQMECGGGMSPTPVCLHHLMGSDLEDDMPLNMLEARNSYGELLKLKVESEEFFFDDLIGHQLDPALV